MAAIAKIVFPSPPPTTNALTSQQRTQLLRSTKKLGRVLGITPQLIDIYPYYTPAESAEWLDDNDFYRPKRRGSVDSISSSSSLSTRSRWSSRSSSRQQSRTSSPASRSLRSSLSDSSTCTEDILLNSDAKPLLRLAMTSPSFDATTAEYIVSPTSSDDGVDTAENLRHTIRPTRPETKRDSSLAVPSFHIPSNNSLRLAKMDRIRKKLGENIPIHLVFPNEGETNVIESAYSRDQPSGPTVTIHWRPLPPLPVEDDSSSQSSTAFSSHTRTRLSNARDSLLIQSSRRAHKIKRKPVPKLDLVELEPTGLFLDAESLTRREKERLSLILELPHEHEDEAVMDLDSDSRSQNSTWFSDGGEDDISFQNWYQNFLKHEGASSH
ncbi:uncharacterized protein C8R40DRAFT_1178270 [Lentinula edodes]|uniref:uncharacterized protein n=1 Tax=Lentinula edodes TaxID=5353 RepID=UPI001E8D8A77|nr:uncharacterized protein C8R40DRAFT_1178270 [Lentinula edodes]KAH7868057.1 hypothetical protein C8R40DRAFT_1178270 [Lentinula edodes]